ncbi:hypothetical protein [Rhizobium sp. NXC14]|nr:hypothetical protein [Rhizobium sp. NXC14]
MLTSKFLSNASVRPTALPEFTGKALVRAFVKQREIAVKPSIRDKSRLTA